MIILIIILKLLNNTFSPSPILEILYNNFPYNYPDNYTLKRKLISSPLSISDIKFKQCKNSILNVCYIILE